jgi:hypothetical protein
MVAIGWRGGSLFPEDTGALDVPFTRNQRGNIGIAEKASSLWVAAANDG